MTTSQIMLKPEVEATCQGKHDHSADSCKEEIEDVDPSPRSWMENETSTHTSQTEPESAGALQTAEDVCLDAQCTGQENVEQAKLEVASSRNGAPQSDKEGRPTISNHSGGQRATNIELSNLIESEAGEAAAAAREERRESSTQTVPDAAAAPASSSFHQSHDRDPNVSGPRGSSGHIAYSGSVSMRSDSSTTSTRSFAFPILPREWSASPVKMAKARKHRWRLMGLKCCKF